MNPVPVSSQPSPQPHDWNQEHPSAFFCLKTQWCMKSDLEKKFSITSKMQESSDQLFKHSIFLLLKNPCCKDMLQRYTV